MCFNELNLDFDKFSPGNAYLITGKNLDMSTNENIANNGVGKSALFSAIFFGLFGDTFHNLSSQSNIHKFDKLNEPLDIILELYCNKDLYTIHNHIDKYKRPINIKIYKNNELVNFSSVKDSRKYIVDKILSLPLDYFKNIVFLVADNNVNFISMNYQDKITFLNRIFKLTKYQQLNEIFKDDRLDLVNKIDRIDNEMKNLERIINDLNININKQQNDRLLQFKNKLNLFKDIIGEKIVIIEHCIEKINNLYANENYKIIIDKIQILRLILDKLIFYKTELVNLIEAIDLAKIENSDDIIAIYKHLSHLIITIHKSIDLNFMDNNIESKLIDINNKIIEYKTKIMSNMESINKKNIDVKNMRSKLNVFKDYLCNNCLSKLDNLIQDLLSEINIVNKSIDEDKKNLSKLNQISDIINDIKSFINNILDNMSNSIRTIENKFKEIELFVNDKTNNENNHIIELLKKNKDILTTRQKEKGELYTKYKYIEFLEKFNKDFIVYMFNNVIEILNKLIEYYINKFRLNYVCRFDSNLNLLVFNKSGIETNYNNLSSGEKCRVNMALLFAIRNLILMRYSISANFMVIDEYFDSNIDEAGLQSIIDVLNDIKNKEKLQLYIITHRQEIKNFYKYKFFDKIISFTKKEANSTYNILDVV